MFGKNPKRPPVNSDGQELDIQDIFYTLQGEGPYVGYSSIFIRLGGCNLACSFCDTEFESYKKLHLDKIKQRILDIEKEGKPKLIVITGGEPFRQNISPLCELLISMGYKIQIETNGTLYFDIPSEVEVICSPKITSGKYHEIRSDLKKHIIGYKFLVSKYIQEYSHIPYWNFDNIPVYVQGIDEYDKLKNIENQKFAVDLSKKYGYILSIQTHKILGIE